MSDEAAKLYDVEIDGCDDSTSFQITATDEQEAFLRELSDKSTAASNYSCMPRLLFNPARTDQEATPA